MAKKKLTIEEKLQAALVPAEEQPYKVPENWCWVKFSVTYDNVSSSKNKIKQKDYQNEGKFAIVDQGENLIGGYSNNEDIVYDGELPVIIFGDHTRRIKYVDFPFIQGADGVKVLQPKNYIVPRYYFFGLQSMQIPHMGYRRHFPILNKMGFPIAPIAEQSRIVARIESLFAKLDEAKEKIQEVLDGADLRRATILHQAFTGKLTEKWRKENSVDDKSWEFTSLGNICYINPKKIDTTNLDDNMKVSFIPMADVSDISGEVIGNQTRPLGEVKKGFTNFNEGDVVFAKITPCMENGKSAIIGKLKNNVGYGTTEFYVLRPKETLYNRYVYHLVRSKFFRDKAKSNMTGAVGQQRVPKKFMQEYEINLPSMPEQQEIVRLLDNLLSREQSTVTACEEALTTIDTLKKSILARAFRGELGTNDPTDPSAQKLLWEILSA
ncbi:restriction endonuclease subunit S [Selenomonas ruminantium]|uniref:restriction endonuclease subunit S n=1 Tax=Selenomonas ruminantium TaxID=971 RepID=UPI0015685F1C|nr:restriction endonuclease subunit S [Selenomonas ruminantium]